MAGASLGSPRGSREFPPGRLIHRSWSLRAWLVLLVLATTMPLAAYGLFHTLRGYFVQRANLIDSTTGIVRNIGRMTAQELDQEILAMHVLAASPALQDGDFGVFAPLARNFLAEVMPGSGLRVFDADGLTLFAMGGVTDEGPPRRRHPETSTLVFAGAAPIISDVHRAQLARPPIFVIDVPVMRGGEVVFDLALSLPSSRLEQIVSGQDLPHGWAAAIIDPGGTIAAHFPNPEPRVGTTAGPAFETFKASGATSGTVDFMLHDGTPALGIFARTPRFGWTTGIAIPQAQLAAPLRASVERLLIAGALALGLSLAFAVAVARRLGRPVTTLARLAAALEGADVVLPHESGLREADGVARVLEDTVRRRRAAEELAEEAEQRASRLIDAVPCGVVVFSPDGRWSFVNRTTCTLLARSAEELLGLTVASADLCVQAADGSPIPPEARASSRALQGEAVPNMEVTMLRGTGGRISLLLSAVPLRDRTGRIVGALTAMLDVTARRAAQDRLDSLLQTLEQRVQEEVAARQAAQQEAAQAQKMQALGQLAGGVAHDFNNVLQAVAGAVSLIERRAGNPEAVRRFARTAAAAAGRGAAVAGRLLTFAHRGELHAAPVEVAPLLRDMVEILAHTLGGQIEVRSEVAGAAGWLMADRPQLQTVLVNLATNARDAMPTGGTLILRAAPEVVAANAGHPAGLAPGRYVRLDAVDTGVGMDAATVARATEPFFSTKPIDKGTGLGLPMARGLVEQLGGGLRIESVPGKGTTVRLWLPAAEPPVTGPASMTEPSEPPHPVLPDGLRVLLVDDEAAVRSVLAEELGERGFIVEQAANAQQAREMLREARFDVLVTDVSMPGESGIELASAARRMRPGMPAMLLTGLETEAVLASADVDAREAAITDVVGKPVRASELGARISRLVAQAAATAFVSAGPSPAR
jgi:PAS domain S-box-containing protein